MYIVSVLATYLKAVHGLLDPEDYESSMMRHGKMEEDAVFIGYSLSLLWAQMNQQWKRSRLDEDIAMNLPSDMPRFAHEWYMRGAFHICHRELKFLNLDAQKILTMEDNKRPGSVFLDELAGTWALIGMDRSESCFADHRNMYMCRQD